MSDTDAEHLVAADCGMGCHEMRWPSVPPVSSNNTLTPGFSANLRATTDPEEPDPQTIKSMRIRFSRELLLIGQYSRRGLLLIRADPRCGFGLIVSHVGGSLIHSLFRRTFQFVDQTGARPMN
jgi:hypothetical protein